MEGCVLPIRALAFIHAKRLYLLAGEGGTLKLFDFVSGELLALLPMFRSDVISGISCEWGEEHQKLLPRPVATVWGGSSMSAVEIIESAEEYERPVLRFCIEETKSIDRIHQALLILQPANQNCSKGANWLALCVTAQNELHKFPVQMEGSSPSQGSRCLATGPRTMLFSADLCVLANERVLVASGTVTGEVLLWSASTCMSEQTHASSKVGHYLKGHNGSVFGVKLSEVVDSNIGVRRLLASCSDDRTIRVWDVTGYEYQSVDSPVDIVQIAVVMGHSSRIWSIDFLYQPGEWPDILSHGEDGTSQVWALHPQRLQQHPQKGDGLRFELFRQATYGYHSGKHVFGVALFHGAEAWRTATGGSDGRVVSYILQHSSIADRLSYQCSISGALQSSQLSATSQRHYSKPSKSLSRRLFHAMQGQWRISRDVKSTLPTQPSGKFVGKAVLRARPVMDDNYCLEMLYAEEGQFSSTLGFQLKAKRQYVYRYHSKLDQISVWFVKSDGETADYLFHTLSFDSRHEDNLRFDKGRSQFKGTGHHLCEQDTYSPAYEFTFKESTLIDWKIDYAVNGPKKDYISTAFYTPVTLPADNGFKGSTNPQKLGAGGEQVPCDDFFKSYAWVSKSVLLATTEHGRILFGKLSNYQHEPACLTKPGLRTLSSERVTWESTDPIPTLRGTSLISIIASKDIAFLTGHDGSILLLRISQKNIIAEIPGSRKIGYLRAQENSEGNQDSSLKAEGQIVVIARGLGEQQSNVHHLAGYSHEILSSRICQTGSSQNECVSDFVTTSSCYVHQFEVLLEGSRYGALRVRYLQSCAETTFLEAHGRDAITVILLISTRMSPEASMIVLTGGRDGRIAYRKLSQCEDGANKWSMNMLHSSSLSIDLAIEGATIQESTHNVMIWGFSSTRFIVWNETLKQQIMSVECGGCHRQWAFHFHHDAGGGNFVWTKASACRVHSQPFPSHKILQSGSHGREIKAAGMQPLSHLFPEDDLHSLIATGAEDTKIRLWTYQDGDLRCTNIMTDHTTGLQRLKWSSDGRWLFSSAGYEEFMAWRVRIVNGVPFVLCEAVCPLITCDRALRVIDFDISSEHPVAGATDQEPTFIIYAIYSDSSLRAWRLSTADQTESSKFALLSTTPYSTCCLTRLLSYATNARRICCTAGGDGHLALWEFGLRSPYDLALVKRHHVHQSSIHALISVNISGSIHEQVSLAQSQSSPQNHADILFITGGDDQALAVTRCTSVCDLEGDVQMSTLLVPGAHASAITDVAYITSSRDRSVHSFATVGTDQRIKIWLMTLGSGTGVDGIELKKARDISTGISDASSLGIWKHASGSQKLFVAGDGIEYWDVEKLK